MGSNGTCLYTDHFLLNFVNHACKEVLTSFVSNDVHFIKQGDVAKSTALRSTLATSLMVGTVAAQSRVGGVDLLSERGCHE